MGYPTIDTSIADVSVYLREVSRWIDASPRNKTNTWTENLLLRTSTKIGEEQGELNGALIGMLGQNPRKGTTHALSHVEKELLDIAFTAIGAVEHLHGNDGESMRRFAAHAAGVYTRMAASIRQQLEMEADLKTQAETINRMIANIEPDPGFSKALAEATAKDGGTKGCMVAYSAQGHIHNCAFEDGHDRMGPGGQNKTLFDHGNPKTQAWWNNDSTHLVIDHGMPAHD